MVSTEEALVLFHRVLSFSSPERRALKSNRRALADCSDWSQQQEKMITDVLGKHLDKENEQDLCVLRKLPTPDPLTSLFEGRPAFLFRVRVSS